MPVQDKRYRLSVLLVTYNHEKFLHQALRTMFGQVLNGPIELVIADDGSSDNTLDIIKQYEGKDPRFHFKYLDNTSNLGVTKNYQRAFAACTGEYVAVLEGDDYWVSPMKLQRQCDFLEAHWECDLCAVNYFVYEDYRSQLTARTAIGYGHRFISARELILDNVVANFSTSMYRKSALDSLPHALFEIISYDWIVNICVARQSLIGFLEEPMSVYRLHSGGVWTQIPYIEQLKVKLDLIPAYDELTDKIFHAEFNLLADNLRHAINASNIGQFAETITQPAAHTFRGLSDYLPPVLIQFASAIMPPILKRLFIRIQNGTRVV